MTALVPLGDADSLHGRHEPILDRCPTRLRDGLRGGVAPGLRRGQPGDDDGGDRDDPAAIVSEVPIPSTKVCWAVDAS